VSVLRADAATDFREGIGGLAQLIGFLQAPFRRQAQPVGDVVVQWAMALTIGHATLAAASCLFRSLLGGKLAVDFMEILRTQVGRALLRHFLGDSNELQHALLGHAGTFREACFGMAVISRAGRD
jgi:hypothetical protein